MRLGPALASVFAIGLVVVGASGARAETRGGQGYVLEIVAPAESKAGAPGTAQVMVRPRAGWKLNTEYPFKLELTPGAGLKVAKSVLRKDDARRFEASGAEVDVVFTPDKAGRADVAATVKFATCDDATCAVHKESFTIITVAR